MGGDTLSEMLMTFPDDVVGTGAVEDPVWLHSEVMSAAVLFLFYYFIIITSCYSTRLSWAHTPVINWVVCLGQMVSC